MARTAPWWSEDPLDWTRTEPSTFRDILKSAYASPEAILRLASQVGMLPLPPRAGNDGADEWTWTIETAVAGRWLFSLFDAVVGDPTKRLYHERLWNCLTDAPASDTADAAVGLQTINLPTEGLRNAAMAVQVAIDARRRIAIIEIAGRAAGTGFLVGPDLLLTAAHVLDARRMPPEPRGAVVAVFDFVPQPGSSPAETGVRVRIVNTGLVGSPPAPNEIEGKASDLDATNEHLDFVLMQLERDMSGDETNGPRRNFYELHADEYAFEQAELLHVYQHPLGMPLLHSSAHKPIKVNSGKTRVRYRANTLPGSSGSPVVDTNGRLVALHHFAAIGSNQGVTIHKIAASIEAKRPLPRLAVAERRARPTRVSVNRLPRTGPFFVARRQEIAKLNECWDDERTHVVTVVAWGGCWQERSRQSMAGTNGVQKHRPGLQGVCMVVLQPGYQ